MIYQNLTLTKEENKLHNINLNESIDITILDKLIHSNLLLLTPWINPKTGARVNFANEKEQLISLRKKVVDGLLTVNYRPPSIGFGRVFPNRSLSLCSIRCEIRHTLARHKYVDIDLENAHPAILKQICDYNKIECKFLPEYVSNREYYLKSVMDAYKVDRKQAKNLFIRLTYFGSFQQWQKDNYVNLLMNYHKCDDKEAKVLMKDEDVMNKLLKKLKIETKELEFITSFTEELKRIGNRIVEANPKLFKMLTKAGKSNVIASVVSTYLQEIEKRLLQIIFSHLQTKKIIGDNCVLCFDGIMIPRSAYKVELLKDLSKMLKEETGFDLNFTQKEMDQDLLDQIKNIVVPDNVEYNNYEFKTYDIDQRFIKDNTNKPLMNTFKKWYLDETNKVLAIKSAYGTGKTVFIDWLIEKYQPPRALFISYRQT